MAVVKERACEYCGKIFKPKQNSRKFCCKRCAYDAKMIYSNCEYCGKKFHNPSGHRFCSYNCANKGKETCKTIECPTCHKIFRQKQIKQKYCSHKCIPHPSKPRLKDKVCPICGVIFHPIRWDQTYCGKTCSRKGVGLKLKEKWEAATPEERTNKIRSWANSSPLTKSKVNIKYGKKLEGLGFNIDSYDFPLGGMYYDLKINNILIEINPYPYHNSTWAPRGVRPKDKQYHINKYLKAYNSGYKCIMVWDWTTDTELLSLINNDFVYKGGARLNRYSPKTKEHLLDEGFNKDKMINDGFVEIYDCGEILISKIKTYDNDR